MNTQIKKTLLSTLLLTFACLHFATNASAVPGDYASVSNHNTDPKLKLLHLAQTKRRSRVSLATSDHAAALKIAGALGGNIPFTQHLAEEPYGEQSYKIKGEVTVKFFGDAQNRTPLPLIDTQVLISGQFRRQHDERAQAIIVGRYPDGVTRIVGSTPRTDIPVDQDNRLFAQRLGHANSVITGFARHGDNNFTPFLHLFDSSLAPYQSRARLVFQMSEYDNKFVVGNYPFFPIANTFALKEDKKNERTAYPRTFGVIVIRTDQLPEWAVPPNDPDFRHSGTMKNEIALAMQGSHVQQNDYHGLLVFPNSSPGRRFYTRQQQSAGYPDLNVLGTVRFENRTMTYSSMRWRNDRGKTLLRPAETILPKKFPNSLRVLQLGDARDIHIDVKFEPTR